MNSLRYGHTLSGALSKTLEERQAREDAEKADYARAGKELAELTATREKKNARKLELSNAIDRWSRQLGRNKAIRLSRATSNSSDASDEEKP